MKSPDMVILSKIQNDAQDILEFIQGHDLDSFIANKVLKKAVVMSILNIGELVKHLSTDFQMTNNNIPWKKISGLRNIAAHSYGTLRMADVWDYAYEDVPVLLEQIGKIFDKEQN
jgi:uncharacterized protein with HEPN domain